MALSAHRTRARQSPLSLLTDPAANLSAEPRPWVVLAAVLASSLAFLALFVQTTLDLQRTGVAQPGRVYNAMILGLLLGSAGVALIAMVLWAVARLSGTAHSPLWTLAACALAYAPALFYGCLGLAANLLWGWNTAASFGATGMVWALAPLIGTARRLAPGKTWLAVTLATLAGALLLAGWVVLGVGAVP
jgi:hypothetical protein